MSPQKPIQASPITVSLHDLQANTVPFSTLLAAFGPDSLGILVVTDLPPEFALLRRKVLADASRLAALPTDKLQRLTNPAAKYLVGWSHGVETLRPGVVDTAKGSYYVNCAFYTGNRNHHRDGEDTHTAPNGLNSSGSGPTSDYKPGSGSASTFASTSASASGVGVGFEEYTAPNIWPDDTDIPNFQADVETLIALIIDTAVLVARACDRFAAAQQIPGYQDGYLERVVRGSTTTKARLLHYFPILEPTRDDDQGSESTRDNKGNEPAQPTAPDQQETEVEAVADTWCTTHLDHGCLTGLTSAMFVDESVTTPASDTEEATTTTTTSQSPQSPQSSNTSTTTTSSSTSSTPTFIPGVGVDLPISPDPSSGLYILSRTGQICKVSIPRDSLAFQTGEALELITRGKFKAVPHFVKGVDPTNTPNTTNNSTPNGMPNAAESGSSRSSRRIARNTLAVFTQPNLDEVVDGETGLTFGEFARGVVKRNTAA